MGRQAGERDDAGFTLVELLVAVVIEAIIVSALGMAFIGILKGTTSVNQSLSRSGDARIAAAYLISDARNSSGPEISLTASTCSDPNPPVAGTAALIVQFGWNYSSSVGSATSDVVDYVLVSHSLLRRECQNGALVSDRAVASNVQSVTAVCSPTADCSGAPTSITVTVTEVADSSGAVYSYSLSATFRKLIGDGPPPSPNSVITLGSGTNCPLGGTGISLTASASMVVYGQVSVNSINNACKALSMTSNSTYQAGATSILAGGTCASTTGASPCPTYTSYSPALPDPYTNLPTPPLTGTAQSGCPGGVAQPGVYANTLTISGTTCQLASGIYILQNGLSVLSSGALTSAAGGVLLYISGGQVKTQSSGSIAISAQTTGSYKGVVMWQPAANTQDIQFTSNGHIELNGTLYAPKSNVNISTTAPNNTIRSVVSQTIWMASGNIKIGKQAATPLSIGNASLPAWTVNRPYPSTTLDPNGGGGLYDWSVSSLPAGLSFDATAGIISGTPTATGSPSVTVTLGDQLGSAVDTNVYTLAINAAPSISTPSPLPTGDKTVSYNSTVLPSGGTAPYTWSATSLPAGLSINSSSGAISGTPTGTGTSTVAVTLTDAAGATASKNLSLTVNLPPSITTASLPAGEKTAPYATTTLTSSGGTAGFTWSATGLPTGLSMSSAGVITGTPSGTPGTASVVVSLTDAANGTASTTLSLVVGAQPTITSVTLKNKTGGVVGKMEAGDQIIVVFSAQMKESSICSTWTPDTSDQSLNADGNVVTVTDGGASNDSVNVAATACTFSFGPMNLGSTGYVTTGNATFGTTGAGNRSTYAWTWATHTLTITLGVKAGAGTIGTVNSNTTPSYAATSTIADSAGGLLGGLPFAVMPGAVRF